jgi:nucleotide-binding universal stress UspA family protein
LSEAEQAERAPCLVAGHDATDSSRLAVSWAANELPSGGRLVLVRSGRSLHAPPSPLSSREERARVGQAIFEELLLDGDEQLLDLNLSTELSDEDPASALIGSAERHHADAIVIGYEPHSAAHRAVGVLTDQLLARSPVPVIAVPSSTVVSRGRGLGRAREAAAQAASGDAGQ